ncbi:MAG: hypothetical protein LBG59_07800, partial [Candidatus Peribacteria bacterium]|nr:hypothetical protein [Candidatus Peribacteria bacterium]
SLAGRTLTGAVFTKIFTDNRTGEVIFPTAQGGTVTTGISVQNIDNIPPTLILNGDEEIILELHTPFIDEGATWIDIVDGTGTILTATSGNVDT